MSQSRKHSLLEVVCSTFVGYGVALTTQILIFPLYGLETNMAVDMQISMIFTVVSVIRSYIFRRFFNRFMGKSTKAEGYRRV